MSAFRDLLKQAHEKGERRLGFEVDLPAFFADEQSQSWIARRLDLHEVGVSATAGRTGEEALRVLVEKL